MNQSLKVSKRGRVISSAKGNLAIDKSPNLSQWADHPRASGSGIMVIEFDTSAVIMTDSSHL